MIESGTAGETYNIGGNNERTNLELIDAICGYLDQCFDQNSSLASRFPEHPKAQGKKTASLIEFVTDRPGHDRRYAIDARKIESELGFRPQTTLDEGIKRTVNWYLENPSWWTPLLRD